MTHPQSAQPKPAITRRLAVLAGVSGLVYLAVFTLPFLLPRLYTTIPPVDYAKLTGYSPAGFIAYVAGLAVLFSLYFAAIRLVKPAGGTAAPAAGYYVWLPAALQALILVFGYPLSAIDLFIYAIRSRGWALYGLNPLAATPDMLPAADPWLGLAAEWAGAASPYGPVWEWLSLGLFHLSGGGFLAHLLALKLLAALAYLGCTWLVYKILCRLQPAWATAGAIAFAWSPLALLESVQNGHNDVLMVFFLLAAVWTYINRPAASPAPGIKAVLLGGLVMFWLALSILVKFVTVLAAPFFIIGLAWRWPRWPGRLAAAAGFGLLLAVLVIAPMWPLWPGWEKWAVLEAGSGAGRSLLALLVLGLRGSLGVNLAFDLSRYFIYALFGLIYLYNLWRTLVSPDSLLLPLRVSFFSLFWYVLLAAPVFHAWYLLWFLPLAALLLPDRRPLLMAAVFSISALYVIPYFETIRIWYPALLENQLLGHLVGVPLLLGPPVIAALWPIRPPAGSEV